MSKTVSEHLAMKEEKRRVHQQHRIEIRAIKTSCEAFLDDDLTIDEAIMHILVVLNEMQETMTEKEKPSET